MFEMLKIAVYRLKIAAVYIMYESPLCFMVSIHSQKVIK